MHGHIPDAPLGYNVQPAYNDMDDEYAEDDEIPAPPRRGQQEFQIGPMDTSKYGMEISSKSWIDRIIDGMKDPLIIAALFMLLSLPQVSRILIQFLPVIGNNLYYSIGFKAVLAAFLFFSIRYFLN